MSKPKYKRGKIISSFEELLKQKFVVVKYRDKYRTTHISFIRSWQVKMTEDLLNGGYLFKAIPLKNREYYPKMTFDDFLKRPDKCYFCLHDPYENISGPDNPLFCFELKEACGEAYDCWLESEVKENDKR